MTKTFLICSLYDRTSDLKNLISSLSDFKDWHVDIVLQKYPKEIAYDIEKYVLSFFPDIKIYQSQEMTGPHLARCVALDSHNSDVWCILDDDMEAVAGKTNYDDMAKIVYEDHTIGILSSNWRKTEKMILKVENQDKLIKQPIVYTGGGMMLRQDVIDIIKNIPRKQYLFDNPLWSIYTFVNGYDNYRWLGSSAIHRICSKGGRRKWISSDNQYKALPPSEWIKTRRGKGKENGFDEYLICDSGDVTDLARELHRRNKK